MFNFYYAKLKNGGKLAKPIKIIFETRDAAQRYVWNNFEKETVIFFDSLEEYNSLMDKIKVEEDKKEQESLKLTDNAKKIADWIQTEYCGGGKITKQFIKDFSLNKDSDKEYYIFKTYEDGCLGCFVTREELITKFQNMIMNNQDFYSINLIEVKTMKEIFPNLSNITFGYENV